MGRAADTAYTAIKERIVRGRLTPNTTVDESEIANELGMSRTPVREALLRLQTESLVDIARGRGIRVLPISITDMREAYQVISGLEMVAVQLLSERAPDAAYLAPLAETVAPRLADDSALVRGAAVWALARLDPTRFEAERARRLPAEADPGVSAEWRGEAA